MTPEEREARAEQKEQVMADKTDQWFLVEAPTDHGRWHVVEGDPVNGECLLSLDDAAVVRRVVDAHNGGKYR